MTKRLILPALITTAVALAGGCSLMKKSAKPRENTSIASETEDGLKQRWIDRRAAELVAQGAAAEAARAQATEEFRAKYPYTGAAQK